MEIPSLSVTPSGTRTCPLRGVLRCDEGRKFLTAMPTRDKRFYGCRKDQLSGCGHVVVTADIIEHHVFGLVLPIAVSTALRYQPRSSSKPRPVQSAAAGF